MKKRWWVLIFLVIVALGGGGYFFLLKESAPEATMVMTSPAIVGDVENQIYTSGTVQSKQETTLFSNNEGTLYGFSKQVGEAVKKGEIVGYIDTADIQNKILALEAQIAIEQTNKDKLYIGPDEELIKKLEEQIFQEETRYEGVLREYERLEQLYQFGAITKQELDKQQEEVVLAESALNIARQNLQLEQKGPRPEDVQSIEATIQKLQLEKAQLERERGENKLFAPANGVVSKIEVKDGQMLSKGTEVLTIIDPDDLQIVAEINESDVSRVEVGQEASIESIALGNTLLPAIVSKISAIAEVKTTGQEGTRTTLSVTLDLLEAHELLRPGFQVDVNIIREKASQAVQVPFEAVQLEEDGTSVVWVIEDGLAKRRVVETGVESELFTEIKTGLMPDEKVILNPAYMQENERVMEAVALY